MTSSDSFHNTKLIAKQAGFIDSDSKQLELINLKSQISCCKALIKATKSLIFQETNIRLAPSEPNIMVKRLNKKGDYLYQEYETNNTDRYGIEFSDNFLTKTKTKIDGKLNEILKKPFDPSDLDYSVIVDRVSFQTALKEADTRKLLTCILICAKSVCFVELMPRDKGNVVRLLKENVKFNPLVMGIGSSEGDINMIQTSDVGIGIQKENHSLVLSYSDIVIKNFNQLEILALIEGHWQYTRLSKAILLFLYKNCFLTMIVFAYTFLCDYSGTSIFDATLLLGYNLFFTSLPILVIGICDEDVPYDKIVQSHKLYQVGINNMLFNRKKIFSYLASAVIQGIILVILIFVGFPHIVNPSGYTADFSYLGTVCYIALISAVLMQTFLDTFCYNLLYYLSHLVSLIILVIFIIIMTYIYFESTGLYSVGTFISNSPIAFFTIIFSSILSILPNCFLSAYNDLFGVNAVDKFKENYSLTNVFISKLDQFKNSLGSLYVNSSTWNNKIEDGKYSINKITLKFNLPHIEKKYKENYIRDFLPLFKWTFGFFSILMIISTIFEFLIFDQNKISALLMIVFSTVCLLVLCLTYTGHFQKNYEFYILLFIGLCIFTRFAVCIPLNQSGILASALVPPFTFLILDVNWLMILILNALNLILFIIAETISYYNTYTSSENALLSVGNIVFILAIYVTSARIGYFFEYSKRMGLKLLNNAHGGVEQIQSVLSILLPKFVRTRVKEGIRYIAEDQGEVTIVFCDICDFDKICKDYNPQELTSFLDKLYSSFDDLCENLGVTKIETVGKTYMACSGLRDSDNDIPISLRNHPHARRGIELAFAIIQEVNSVQLKNGNTLQVKIGVNSGTVAAGVVGHHKPQFSLVCDTVNTASRMCSTLDTANKIQISKATYDFISHYTDLEFTPKVVYAKGKGNIDVFVLTESKPDNSDIAGGFTKCNSNSNFYTANSFIPEVPSSDDNNSKKITIKKIERTSKQ